MSLKGSPVCSQLEILPSTFVVGQYFQLQGNLIIFSSDLNTSEHIRDFLTMHDLNLHFI